MIESLILAGTLHAGTAGQTTAEVKADKVVSRALNQRGSSYINGRWHGCAGFVSWAYRPWRSLPTYSGAQKSFGKPVSRKNLKPGDILLYGRGASRHASLYIGHGKQIGANNPRAGVKVDSIHARWWTYDYYGARRIFK